MNRTKGVLSVITIIAVSLVSLNVSVVNAITLPNRVIVTFAGDVNNAKAKDVLEKAGGTVVKELPNYNSMAVILPSKASEKALKNKSEVLNVEEDVVVSIAVNKNARGKKPPKDNPPPQPSQVMPWGVSKIKADEAWVTSTGNGINVMVLDTGIDASHPDLSANVKGGVNFVPRGRKVYPSRWGDDNGHGTHVAGTIGASNNDIGVVGVAPDVNLYAVKVLNKEGNGYLSDVVLGIDWAVANGADVINMSLGSTSGSSVLEEAVSNAYNAGVVVVAASGNSGDGDISTNNVEYPAKYQSVIAVGASDSSEIAPSWSSDGEEVEVSSPGVGVLSTYLDGGYATGSGTSMASPHVAGAVALLLATNIPSEYDDNANNSWDPSEVRFYLSSNAKDLGTTGYDVVYGNGLVQLDI
jgi:subtilisin family serine protease